MTSSSALEAVLKRDRLIVVVGLTGVTVLAWLYLVLLAAHRKSQQQGNPFVPTSAFALGYMLVWSGFSVAATILQ